MYAKLVSKLEDIEIKTSSSIVIDGSSCFNFAYSVSFLFCRETITIKPIYHTNIMTIRKWINDGSDVIFYIRRKIKTIDGYCATQEKITSKLNEIIHPNLIVVFGNDLSKTIMDNQNNIIKQLVVISNLPNQLINTYRYNKGGYFYWCDEFIFYPTDSNKFSLKLNDQHFAVFLHNKNVFDIYKQNISSAGLYLDM